MLRDTGRAPSRAMPSASKKKPFSPISGISTSHRYPIRRYELVPKVRPALLCSAYTIDGRSTPDGSRGKVKSGCGPMQRPRTKRAAHQCRWMQPTSAEAHEQQRPFRCGPEPGQAGAFGVGNPDRDRYRCMSVCRVRPSSGGARHAAHRVATRRRMRNHPSKGMRTGTRNCGDWPRTCSAGAASGRRDEVRDCYYGPFLRSYSHIRGHIFGDASSSARQTWHERVW